MSYTTKIKYYRDEKVSYIFSKPIMTDYIITDELIKKRVESRKNNTDTQEENKERSVGRARIQIYDMAIMNDWDWFVTLTLNPAKVDSFDYSSVSKIVSKWLNNMKSQNPDMKYLLVPEKHESGRYHFHALMSGLNPQIFDLSGKKDNKGRDIYNLGKYKLGWSTATKIGYNERAVKYLTKYITKDTMQVTKNKKKYWCSSNLILPKVDKLDLSKSQQSALMEYEKEKSTPARVLQIENESYTNTLTIYKTKLDIL